ncbi:hypothetical protein GcC1_084014 [Golovinomyces cichoracearum]|uniref:Uncharacterized protein n=1 Tax=Golovinomyces cichoracearum TaxID=62708 RepID=A0A420IIU7_9PEZI|nr:hypothetical protein GcC1_084014 [Golovinomyces cichoracearum]
MTSQAVNLDFSKLTDKDKKELQQFIASEEQKAIIQSCANPQSDRCLLEKMYHRDNSQWKIRQHRGDMRTELCRTLYGFEILFSQAFRKTEAKLLDGDPASFCARALMKSIPYGSLKRHAFQ